MVERRWMDFLGCTTSLHVVQHACGQKRGERKELLLRRERESDRAATTSTLVTQAPTRYLGR